MARSTVTIMPASEADIPVIVDLVIAQQERQLARDSHLAVGGSRASVEGWLREHIDTGALVALDARGQIRGYAQPTLWALKPSSILLSFLTARNGIVQKLTLPDPTDEDAVEVTSALLSELDSFWKRENTSGDLIRWPSQDDWFATLFAKQGFQLDSICALRSLQPFFPSRPEPATNLHIRNAQPDDEEGLIELFQGELLFHERYTPFVRSSPQVLDAFRRKLGHLWKGEGLEEGAPLVLVAEREGVIVAMAENTLITVTPDDEPGFTPEGRYWCIDNVSVRDDLHGQGIGRALVQAIEDTVASQHLDLDGYALWFNPDNLSAARFWTRLGFQPLWTTYQRLHITTAESRS